MTRGSGSFLRDRNFNTYEGRVRRYERLGKLFGRKDGACAGTVGELIVQ